MEIRIKIEADKIKKSLGDFKGKIISNKKQIVMVLVGLYCIGSFLYIMIGAVSDYSGIVTVEGYCKNISGHNITINGATYHIFSSLESSKEYFEGYDIRIVMYYSNRYDAYVWKSVRCI